MRTLTRSLSSLAIALCLLLGQPSPIAAQTTLKPSSANFNLQTNPTIRVASDAKDLDEAFQLAFQIMQRKDLYRFLNEKLNSIVVPVGAPKNQGLSMSQIVYILLSERAMWGTLRGFIEGPDLESLNALTAKARQDVFQSLFDQVFHDSDRLTVIMANNEGARPLRLQSSTGNAGYSQIRMYVNHPILTHPDSPKSPILPASDLRQLVVSFILGAKHEIMYNVFDFDLQVVADALIAQGKKGLRVHGGVDAGTYKARAEVRAVVDQLLNRESSTFQTTLVNSVGLNHQKIIVRDAGTPDAAVLLLSGNFTQSCLGPEGDLVTVKAELRPPESLPNANHAVMIKGTIPAAVVKQELNKTLVAGVRGRTNYPLGGAYQIMGPKSKNPADRDWIILAFSPNGGLGDINRDILTRVINETKGPIETVQFAFSSEILAKTLISKVTKEIGVRRATNGSIRDLFQSVGDTPFALRGWSVFINLSGLRFDKESSLYQQNADFPLKNLMSENEWQQWQSQIRTAPTIYGDRQMRIEGTTFHVTSKIHHKVFVFPESDTAVIGTSFNPSANAETNNEQILVVHNKRLTRQAQGLFRYLYTRSNKSVAAAAAQRNSRQERQTPSTNEDGVTEIESREAM